VDARNEKPNESTRNLNIAALRSFVDVIERGSVTATARAFHLSQSAVSTQLAGLARLSGGPLFDRRDGRLELTELGRIVYDSSNEVIESVESFRTRISNHVRANDDAVSVASSRAACEATLARTVSGFETAAPASRVAVTIEPTAAVLRLLAADAVDAVLIESANGTEGFRFVPYATACVRIAVPPGHRLARKRSVTFDDLLETRVVAQNITSATRRFVEAQVGARFDRLDVALEVESNEALVACIEAGIGVGFVADPALARSVALGSLVALDLTDVDLTRTFAIGYRERRSRPVVRRFIEWVIGSSTISA